MRSGWVGGSCLSLATVAACAAEPGPEDPAISPEETGEEAHVCGTWPEADPSWSRPVPNALGTALATDAEGNLILAGSRQFTKDGDLDADIWVAKRGPDGVPLWEARADAASASDRIDQESE